MKKVHPLQILLLGFLFTYLAIESVAVLTLVARDKIHDPEKTLSAIYENYKKVLLVAWDRQKAFGDFDPLLSIRLVPHSKYGELEINEFGFVGNGSHEERLRTFPEKPPGMVRIILLGNSTTAGIGLSRNEDTIASQLEAKLNAVPRKDEKYFQVLNFGGAGGNTGTGLQRFALQLVYYTPDIVISLDGLTDLWNTLYEKYRVGIESSVLNWSDFHYLYFHFMNGIAPGQDSYTQNRFFTFASLLLQSFRTEKSETPGIYKAFPWYEFSKNLQKSDPFLSRMFYENLNSLAGLLGARGTKFLSYLQPCGVTSLKKMPEDEEKSVFGVVEKIQRVHPTFTKEEFKKQMTESMQAYHSVIDRLSEKYSGRPDSHFQSLESVFDLEPDQLFIDYAHFTKKGAKILADRYFKDLQKYGYLP